MGSRKRIGPDGRVIVGGYYAMARKYGVKVLLPANAKNCRLPEVSHHARVYATIYRSGDKIGMIKQLRIYGPDHFPLADIDFGHEVHHGLRGGDIHVHAYSRNEHGHPVRPQHGRPLNPLEKRLFAKIMTDRRLP